jgi:hypothetical protein
MTCREYVTGRNSMLDVDTINTLREMMTLARRSALEFFGDAQKREDEDHEYSSIWQDLLTSGQRETGIALSTSLKRIGVEVAGAARGSPLLGEADLQDLRYNTRRMAAALRFRKYRQWGVYIHHDADIVLGVDPPGQIEEELPSVNAARLIFEEAASTTTLSIVTNLCLPDDGR